MEKVRENLIGADNQQERSRGMDNHYMAGFVDGEGSFHVVFQKSLDVKLGWQAIPEFHVSQNASSLNVLEKIKERLNCGVMK